MTARSCASLETLRQSRHAATPAAVPFRTRDPSLTRPPRRDAGMQEIELKLQIPPAARAAVDKALHGRGTPPQRTHLVAAYFDTADRRLARAGMALRVRREGRQWVQTIKAGGPHALQRLEHNVARRPPAGGVLTPDLSLHDGTPAQALLRAALAPTDGEGTPPLLELYRTDIWRTSRTRRTPLGTVELAWDEGRITADGRKLPVSELEIELVRGDVRAVVEEARRWVQAHGLWLDTQTKAHRGDHLARDARPQARNVSWPALQAGAEAPGVGPAWVRIHAGLLDGLLAHASAIATGQGSAEHTRRLRVGLRRLRSAWRLFSGWGPAVPDDVKAGVVALYRLLGQARDGDVLGGLRTALLQAGAPADVLAAVPAAIPAAVVDVPAASGAGAASVPGAAVIPGQTPAAAGPAAPAPRVRISPDELAAHLRSPAVHQLWLDLLLMGLPQTPPSDRAPRLPGSSAARQDASAAGAVAGEVAGEAAGAGAAGSPAATAGCPDLAPEPAAAASDPASADRPLRPLALHRLKRWHRSAARHAERYAELTDVERHELRKRLKRLRDALDALATLLPARRLRRQLATLRAAQDALGRLHDEVVAAEWARQQAEGGHGPAWFIVGWLAAQRPARVQAAARALRDWRKAPTCWG